MDIGTVLSVAQTLFASLQCKELQEMCSVLGYRSQLEELECTVSTIKAVLLDAEAKQELNHEAQLYIEELKDAVYDADDLLDKFSTMVKQNQLIKGGKASKKVRTFFSRYNPRGVAYNMSQGVKKIRKSLDAIANNHAQFGFSIDPQPIRLRREETCSYVYQGNIVGREDDVEKIVGHLLNDSCEKDVSFLTIVGIGGLGTTRSHKTASIIGDDSITHVLQGLSKENAWRLFKKVAFGSEQSTPQDELLKIGQEIVEVCACVPLAIRVVGSLLYGQDKSKWLLFQKIGLCNFRESQKDIMSILKLSYHQLESPLKSCFTYCALFPKDSELEPDTLKSLWMAQGYIIPLDDALSMEDSATEYFSVLLRRCFFQDVVRDPFGEIISCKMHDLMHDLALSVAGKEICVPNFAFGDVDKKAWHLAYTSREFAHYSYTNTRLRSYLYVGDVGPMCIGHTMILSAITLEAMLTHWKCLRVLDLRLSLIANLPDSIGKLVHLRYLDLRRNLYLKVFPKSILKLYNLQTLKLGGCSELKELPREFMKLVSLRTLVISACGMKCLTCLGSLPFLRYLELSDLRNLEYIIEDNNLGGNRSAYMSDGRLTTVGTLSFPSLETLQMCNLHELKEWGKPRVMELGDDDNSGTSRTPLLLPQLKSFTILTCPKLKCKVLLPNLELLHSSCFDESVQINRLGGEIQDENAEEKSSCSTTPSSALSCSYGLPKLRKVIINNAAWLKKMPVKSFQCLDTLFIWTDHKVESLGEAKEVFRSCSSSLMFLEILCCCNIRGVMSGGLEYLSALKTLSIDSCEMLNLSEGENDNGIGKPTRPPFYQSLCRLSLTELPSLVHLPNWIQFLSALKTLQIDNCKGLETMPDWMPKLTSLGELQLHDCSESLTKRCQKIIGEDWPLIQHIPSVDIVQTSEQEVNPRSLM